jgi:hypothetical protein
MDEAGENGGHRDALLRGAACSAPCALVACLGSPSAPGKRSGDRRHNGTESYGSRTRCGDGVRSAAR